MNNINIIKYKIRDLWLWIRFGKIREIIRDTMQYTPCEIEYKGRFNKTIGYWAYGSWCPDLPFKG